MRRLAVRFGSHCLVFSSSERRSWSDIDARVNMGTEDRLRLMIDWSDELHWLTLESPPILPNQERQTIRMGELIEVTYHAQKCFNPQLRCVTVVLYVDSLSLLKTMEEAWDIFEKAHGHRLVCMMRFGQGGQSYQTYLGRAQRIETNNNERIYTWLPGKDDNDKDTVVIESDNDGERFPSPRSQDEWMIHAREAKELALLSSRKEIASSELGDMDHDRFVNTRRALPVSVKSSDKEVQWQFFNLHGKGFVETSHIAWSSIPLKPKRLSLRPLSNGTTKGALILKMTPETTAVVHFKRGKDQDCLSVTQITLQVQDYTTTLSSMGEGLAPKTI